MKNKKLMLLTVTLAILIATSGTAAFYMSNLNKNHSEDKMRAQTILSATLVLAGLQPHLIL
jgi:hypothetical protein